MSPDKKKKLHKLRKKLDNLDYRLLNVIKKRTEIVKKVLLLKTYKKDIIDKKRILVPLPLPLAELSASIFEIMPNPLLTRDQLRLLKYDNISSGKYKTNFQIGIPSLRRFDDEVKKYSYMWREGGQFSTEKYL